MSNFFTPEFNNESAIAPWNTSLEPTPGIIPKLDANRTLTGGVGQEVNIPTLTPNSYDNIILPDASPTLMAKALTTDSNTSLQDSSVDLLTGQAMSEVYEDLSKFAAEPDFVTKMNVAFGENWDAAGGKALAEGWFNRDFSAIPPVKVVSSAEIGGANGAFAAATDTIYLSKEFLDQNGANPAAVADVLLEEIGHSVDARLNVTDSPGDEGAIFSRVVQGKELSQGELQALKGEDDREVVAIDGQQYLIEKQLSSFPIQGSIRAFYDRNPSIANQLGKPTGAEYQFVSSKWRQNFQNGAIFHSAQGTFSVRGSLGNYYLNSLGGQNSQLGLPTSEESQLPPGSGNWRQSFEKGTLEWLSNGTPRVTLTTQNLFSNPSPSNPLRGFVHPLGQSVASPISWNHNSMFGQQYAVDFPARIGTQLYAMRAGTVVDWKDSTPDRNSNLLSIDDGRQGTTANYLVVKLDDNDGIDDGYRAMYLHLQQGSIPSKFKRAGARVEVNEQIGKVGYNGVSQGVHSHVEINKLTGNKTNMWQRQTIPFQWK
ncbi:peptidoglycan DD-metalloendopeptidase family protein [Microcoleus sp. Aus8_D1]|uniref:peptidoglycan DD-metalloendopeptidase family protein n=1 Tax=Microcoleus sp. Aus8_D2 TaxID=2818632 RepID=UPI002FD66659